MNVHRHIMVLGKSFFIVFGLMVTKHFLNRVLSATANDCQFYQPQFKGYTLDSPDHHTLQISPLISESLLVKTPLVTSPWIHHIASAAYSSFSLSPFPSKCVVVLSNSSLVSLVHYTIVDILDSVDKYAGSRLCYSCKKMLYTGPLISRFLDLHVSIVFLICICVISYLHNMHQWPVTISLFWPFLKFTVTQAKNIVSKSLLCLSSPVAWWEDLVGVVLWVHHYFI